MKVAILDDYQNVSMILGHFDKLKKDFSGKPDVYKGSLGFVQASDVLLIELFNLDVPSPLAEPVLIDNITSCPGGREAIESFAELLRIASST